MKKIPHKIKVLHFTDNLRAGGRERQLVELLKGLSLKKEIVCHLVLMSKDIHYKKVHNLNINIHYLIRKSKRDPRILFKLYNLCRYIRPDILHTWDSMASVYAAPIVKIMNIKFVNGMIRDAPLKIKRFKKNWLRTKFTYPFSDIIVSNSLEGIKSYNAPLKKCLCIYNGFDFDRTKNLSDKSSMKKELKLNTEKIVGMVATFSDFKDYKTFILAGKFILKKRKNVIFLAIGDGKNLENTKTYLEPEISDNFRFLGRRDSVESIINIFDVGVLSTNAKMHGEGISNSVMEYMALRKPVVATNSGGTKEIIINDITGFIVPAYNVKALSYRIMQLLDNKKRAIEMGKEGRKRIIMEFNLKKMTDEYLALYKRIL